MRVFSDVPYGPYGERNLMNLYLPEDTSSPRPLVICIHGGGWSGGMREHYTWMAEPLVSRGFAMASITYRFWPQAPYPAAIDDVQRAVCWLRSRAAEYGLDPQRFGAIGGSAGAHLAAFLALTETRDNSDAALVAYSSRVSCVVDCYGPVDFVRMMDSASAPIVEGFMAMPFNTETEAMYRQASPYYQIPSNPPPFLIVHGTCDIGINKGQVPIDISEAFCTKLNEAGGEATFVAVEGAPHGFSKYPPEENQYAKQMWEAAVPFFERHLAVA